jgi:hypothetical protein
MAGYDFGLLTVLMAEDNTYMITTALRASAVRSARN